MDVFRLHSQLIGDYAEFTRSFVDIRDKRIAEVVEEAIDSGLLWSDLWVQLIPSFEPGALTDELADTGVFHPAIARICRGDRTRRESAVGIPSASASGNPS